MKAMEQLERDIVEAASDDWVHLDQLAWFVSQRCPDLSHSDRPRAGVRALRSLLEQGLILVGDVEVESGFRAWPLSIDQIIERFEAGWIAMDHDPLPGDVGWLAAADRKATDSG